MVGGFIRIDKIKIMKKFVDYIDENNFGNRIIIYDAKNFYFCIIIDRNEFNYFYINKNLNWCFCINNLMSRKNMDLHFPVEFDLNLEVNVSDYLKSDCNELIKKLIIKSKNNY